MHASPPLRRNRSRVLNRMLKALLPALLFAGTLAPATAQPVEQAWSQFPEIVKRIVPPKFPARDFVITHYGAVGDGIADCTEAFRKAIDACHAAGGGRVVVPSKGIFLTGAIHLLSDVNLFVDKAATIRFCRARSPPSKHSRTP